MESTTNTSQSQQAFAPKTLHEMLAILRERNWFLFRYNINNFRSFLMGFAMARSGIGDSHCFDWLDEFQSWVCKRFGMRASWEQVIFCSVGAEVQEMELFWELYDEFEAERRDKIEQSHP